jgi:uncharacterized protein YjbI with pentapeptide repeats
MDIDLTGAVLKDFNFPHCRAHQVNFERAHFSGDAWFGGVHFNGIDGFVGPQFRGLERFDVAHFSGDAGFDRALFATTPDFEKATARADGRHVWPAPWRLAPTADAEGMSRLERSDTGADTQQEAGHSPSTT